MDKGVPPTDRNETSFTVFKSPPWSIPPSVKHVTFSEAFPAIGTFGGRRVKVMLSKSLESIPENAVWSGGRNGGPTTRDAVKFTAHGTLPPIKHITDGELPEMRARAFSDPNAYLSTPWKDRSQPSSRTEPKCDTKATGESSRSAPRPPITPPLKKSQSPKQSRKTGKRWSMEVSNAEDMALNHADNLVAADSSSLAKDPIDSTAACTANTVRRTQQLEFRDKSGARPAGHQDRTLTGAGEHGLAAAATTKSVPGLSNGTKFGTKESVAGALHQSVGVGPAKNKLVGAQSVAAADTSSSASRQHKGLNAEDHGIQPKIVHPPKIEKNARVQLSRYLRQDKEETPRTAFALVGSPGRKRWPSPQRLSTSFISRQSTAVNSTGSHSYSGPMSPIAAAMGADCGRSSSSSSEDGDGSSTTNCGREHTGAIDIKHHSCSKEFRAILSGFLPTSPPMHTDSYINSDGDRFEESMSESRAHFLRAGRPISDSL